MKDSPIIDSKFGDLNGSIISGSRLGLILNKVSTKWGFSTFSGRFTEISGDEASASLTIVFRLVLESQKLKEPVVWIGNRQSMFFPPDAADAGVDLRNLAVVLVSGTRAAARATDHLLRSGSY